MVMIKFFSGCRVEDQAPHPLDKSKYFNQKLRTKNSDKGAAATTFSVYLVEDHREEKQFSKETSERLLKFSRNIFESHKVRNVTSDFALLQGALKHMNMEIKTRSDRFYCVTLFQNLNAELDTVNT